VNLYEKDFRDLGSGLNKLWLIYLKALKKDQEDQRLYPVVNLLIDL
jgi:hypothetical protein